MGTSNKKLRVIAVSLLALQMSFDSSVYLTSIVHFVESITPGRSSYYLDVAQATGASVQIVISLIIGYLAQWVKSVKWVLIPTIFLSAIGNFLYSCAGEGALNSPNIVIAGRILCGASSASGALAYTYIAAVYKESTKDTFFGFRVFRNSIALYMILAQVVSIGLSYCDFLIGDYHIDSNNAPTFITSFIIGLNAIVLSFILEDPDISVSKKRPDNKDGNDNMQKKMTWALFWYNYGVPIMTILTNLIASFSISVLTYMFPLFLSLKVEWGTLYQSIDFIVVIFTGTTGAIVLPLIISKLKKDKSDYGLLMTEAYTALVSMLITLIGFAIMVSTYVSFKPGQSIGYAVGFSIGMALVFTGYNSSASNIPSIYKQTIPKRLVSVTLPFVAAVTGLGKLLAPIICENIYNSPAGGGMALGMGIIFTAMGVLVITIIITNLPRYRKQNTDKN